ncbi:MAG: MFS transporter [Kofleriaceae bacterium]|nr:MFS transporter [Kofleriaceae bacterium]
MSRNFRISLALAAVFFVLGMHLPYFPVWLKSRGLGAEHIGFVLGGATWMKVVATPLIGHWVARSGGPRRIAVLLALITASLYVALWSTSGWLTTIVLALALGAAYGPIISLLDGVAVRVSAGQASGSYGRIRRWGSVAFILASLLGGALLETGNQDIIIITLAFSALALVLALFLIPENGPPIKQQSSAKPAAWSEIIPVLATTSLLHGSHAMLYGFGSTQWQSDGVAESTIGWLWTFGVFAEILVFSFSHRIAHWNSSRLLIVASVGGLIRWPLLALLSAPVLLFSAQILHALTFGALHLGAMTYIQNRVRPAATSTVTAYYSASSGMAIGLSLLLAGVLNTHIGRNAYFAMCVFSALGFLGALYCGARARDLDAAAD